MIQVHSLKHFHQFRSLALSTDMPTIIHGCWGDWPGEFFFRLLLTSPGMQVYLEAKVPREQKPDIAMLIRECGVIEVAAMGISEAGVVEIY